MSPSSIAFAPRFHKEDFESARRFANHSKNLSGQQNNTIDYPPMQSYIHSSQMMYR
jgi:hypothetical protein